MSPMIKVSESAIQKIKCIQEEEEREGSSFLRIYVKKGGCSGFSYKLKFDDRTNESDQSFNIDEIKVVVDKESLLYLIGMTLDYEGGLNGQGFIFSNPNAAKTCGCGSSFAV